MAFDPATPIPGAIGVRPALVRSLPQGPTPLFTPNLNGSVNPNAGTPHALFPPVLNGSVNPGGVQTSVVPHPAYAPARAIYQGIPTDSLLAHAKALHDELGTRVPHNPVY